MKWEMSARRVIKSTSGVIRWVQLCDKSDASVHKTHLEGEPAVVDHV